VIVGGCYLGLRCGFKVTRLMGSFTKEIVLVNMITVKIIILVIVITDNVIVLVIVILTIILVIVITDNFIVLVIVIKLQFFFCLQITYDSVGPVQMTFLRLLSEEAHQVRRKKKFHNH
jgi:hypothetical protein